MTVSRAVFSRTVERVSTTKPFAYGTLFFYFLHMILLEAAFLRSCLYSVTIEPNFSTQARDVIDWRRCTNCLPFAVTLLPASPGWPLLHFCLLHRLSQTCHRRIMMCYVVISVCLHVMLLSLPHAGPQQAAVLTTVPTHHQTAPREAAVLSTILSVPYYTWRYQYNLFFSHSH